MNGDLRRTVDELDVHVPHHLTALDDAVDAMREARRSAEGWPFDRDQRNRIEIAEEELLAAREMYCAWLLATTIDNEEVEGE